MRVSNERNLRRKTVELRQPEARPSRIRREPAAAAPERKSVQPYPTEREVWAVVIGVVLFAIAITIIIFGIGSYTSH
jgi:hypothetical protein